jgi:hypothetical protein
MARRLRAPAWLLWACILSSPALVSQSIVGLPHLTSAAIPFGLAIGWVLTEARRRRSVVAGLVLDVVVFTIITFVAFNGYESGKTFFVVPVPAALTLRGVPVVRRLGWLGCAMAAAWLVHDQQPMTTEAALASIPHDAAAFVQGISRIPRRYFLDWWIDFPALFFAAVVSLFRLRSNRLFWVALFAASAGLVSLSAFQYGGGFLAPPRFLLLIFVSALIVTVALSERDAGGLAGGAVVLLLVTGIGYTTYLTVGFAREKRTGEVRDGNVNSHRAAVGRPGGWVLRHGLGPGPRGLQPPAALGRAAAGAARMILRQAESRPAGSKEFIGVSQRRVPTVHEAFSRSAAAHVLGYLDNTSGAPLRARLAVEADDELAVLVNGQTIVESLGWKGMERYDTEVVLPPGPIELRIGYHKFGNPGGVTFTSTGADGQSLAWRCSADFRSREAAPRFTGPTDKSRVSLLTRAQTGQRARS